MILSDTPKIQAFNMDCMEFMKDNPDNYYDLAIVDPPYGIGNWVLGIPAPVVLRESFHLLAPAALPLLRFDLPHSPIP